MLQGRCVSALEVRGRCHIQLNSLGEKVEFKMRLKEQLGFYRRCRRGTSVHVHSISKEMNGKSIGGV